MGNEGVNTRRQKKNRHFARQAQTGTPSRPAGALEAEPRTNPRFAKKPGGSLAAVGVRGLRHASGHIQEEWRNEFKSWSRAVKHYLEMRDDIIIGTLLDALKFPLKAAQITTAPAEGGTAGDQAAADWLHDTMHRMHRQTWKSHVSDCLDAIDFGWNLSEIVLEKRGDGRMWLRNVDPRGQETLERWKFYTEEDKRDEVEAMIQRDPNTSQLLEIPISKAVHVTFRGRKGNPEGKSLLYSLYRPYRFCKDFENFEGVGIERDVGGMPVAEIDKEVTLEDQDVTDLENGMAGMRRDENEYLLPPPGVKIVPYGSSNKMYDVGAVIERKQKEILGRVFAQFLKLGMDNVGTQALVKGSQAFFNLALEAIQEELLEAWNLQLVPYLFSFNSFPGMTDYPTIEWEKPGAVDLPGIIGAVNTAAGAKLFTPTDIDEDHLRELMDFPELPEDERGMPRAVEEPPMAGIFQPRREVAAPPVR